MKTLLPIRIKCALAVLVLLFVFSSNLLAQPQYYNFNTASGSNVFPFGTLPATGKTTQTLYLPGAFVQPSPAPGGNITKIYFQSVAAGSPTYTQLTIKMGLTSDVDLPVGAWYTGTLTTV